MTRRPTRRALPVVAALLAAGLSGCLPWLLPSPTTPPPPRDLPSPTIEIPPPIR